MFLSEPLGDAVRRESHERHREHDDKQNQQQEEESHVTSLAETDLFVGDDCLAESDAAVVGGHVGVQQHFETGSAKKRH